MSKKTVEKKSNRSTIPVEYTVGIIAFLVLFALAVGSNFYHPERTAPGIEIDGETYTIGELNYYYANIKSSYDSGNNSMFASMFGYDANTDPKEQEVSSALLSSLGIEYDTENGNTWYDYFYYSAIQQMLLIRAANEKAEREGYVYPEAIKATLQKNKDDLKQSAIENNLTYKGYIGACFGGTLTEKQFNKLLEDNIRSSYYLADLQTNYVVTDEEIRVEQETNGKEYKNVSYEYAEVSFADDDLEESEKTQKAESIANEIKARCDDSGETLDDICNRYLHATYHEEPSGVFSGSERDNWLFSDERTEGDTVVMKDDSSDSIYYVIRYRREYTEDGYTYTLRQFSIQRDENPLDTDDENYAAKEDELNATIDAKAKEILAQWKKDGGTEDAFAQLAYDNNSMTGGLVKRQTENTLDAEIYEWASAAEREAGDTLITESGNSRILSYWVCEDMDMWKAKIYDAIVSKAMQEWSDSATSYQTCTQLSGFKNHFVERLANYEMRQRNAENTLDK